MTAPRSVAIVAMGPSGAQYVGLAARVGKRAVADEIWAINAMGDVIHHDRLFMMDDFERQIRPIQPGWLEWVKFHPVPVITSRADAGLCQMAVDFPLGEVVQRFGVRWFTSTVAYAIAYALFIGVKEIKLFGCDFSDPSEPADQRDGAEFWLMMAGALGVQISITDQSPLLYSVLPDAERNELLKYLFDRFGAIKQEVCSRPAQFYGYDPPPVLEGE